MCLLLIVACDSKPTFDDIKKNFYMNRLAFNELADVTCKLGLKKQVFSYELDSFSYSPDKVKQEFKNKTTDALLVKIGAYAINYKKTLSGKCSLVVGYYARGFAGNGIVYDYSFQKESINLFKKEKHTFEEISNAGLNVSFDMPLNNGWYFTFTYS